ncbi:hypothetical protein ACWD4O_12095 [Streptomyces sp. NPDC002623]|uniref:hypothetical protein n=1 Tax=Streptomyces sp. NPDC020951 TaxID=3365104 RepID=UPI0037920280
MSVSDAQRAVRSRARSGSTDGAPLLRFVLNLAPSPATDIRTGTQHIALTTDDITAAARHDFAPGELDTYRELGILCDRDEDGGEFHHFYTATVGRIFFEVVQRTGGYGGYGAANAPVRLAAQR